MGLTSTILEELGIVDATIPEPQGGAHRDIDSSAERVREHLLTQIKRLQALPEKELLDIRYDRLMSYGTS
jgi:acetyl-CoA carboxylase carboxyl transferase subunit alpha